MKRPATRIVKIVKHDGAFSTDDILAIFMNTDELNKMTAGEAGRLRIMANTMIELVQQGKFDLRTMQ